MLEKVNVLIVEDSQDDALLLAREIKKGGYELFWKRVDSLKKLHDALDAREWDLIVIDFVLPDFNGIEVLDILRERLLDIPSIVVSGKMGEETAVEVMRAGANDYILKGNYSRLVPAIKRELREAGIRREKKQAEKALKESEVRYRALIESSSEHIFMLDPEGFYLTSNDMINISGYKKGDELIGKNVKKVYSGNVRAYYLEMFNEVLETGEPREFEHDMPYGDETCYHLDTLYPIFRNDVIWAVGGICRDITEKKSAEKELIRLSTAVKMSTDSIMVMDLDRKIADVNNSTIMMYGVSNRTRMVGKAFSDMISEKDRNKTEAKFHEIMEKGTVNNVEYLIKTFDGGEIPVEGSFSLMKDGNDNPIGFTTIMRDISERKRKENEMKRKLMLYKLVEGNVYLVKESTVHLSIKAFQDLIKVGFTGVLISRTPRDRINYVPSQEIEHYWLSDVVSKNTISPSVETLKKVISEVPERRALFIDRLDYVASKNGFKDTLDLVHFLKDIAYVKDHVILISLDPYVMDEKENKLLEKETMAVEPMFQSKLPDDLMEIIRHVRKENLMGIKPTYTDVSTELSLSKPTVRKRIQTLVMKEYLVSSAKGRTKTVEIAEKGRRLFLD